MQRVSSRSPRLSFLELSGDINVLRIVERAYDIVQSKASCTPHLLALQLPYSEFWTIHHLTYLLSQFPEPPFRNYTGGSQPELKLTGRDKNITMRVGMLVPGDQIGWRSDEVWWDVSYPPLFHPSIF